MVPRPAIEQGLGLVDRVVRRHVAKLEKAGWCQRMPKIRGDGMLVWLTPSGLDGVELSELPALRTPDRFSLRTSHSIRVAWAAADIERAGHQWMTSREMTLTPSRWGAQVANERGGHSRRLPDLAFRPTSDGSLPVAVIVILGQSNPRREPSTIESHDEELVGVTAAPVRIESAPVATADLRRPPAAPVVPQWSSSAESVVDARADSRTPAADPRAARRRGAHSSAAVGTSRHLGAFVEPTHLRIFSRHLLCDGRVHDQAGARGGWLESSPADAG